MIAKRIRKNQRVHFVLRLLTYTILWAGLAALTLLPQDGAAASSADGGAGLAPARRAPATIGYQAYIAAADRDSYLAAATPAANYGNAADLRVREDTAGASTRALYRFDLSGVPANSHVQSATMNLFVTQAGGSAVSVSRVTENWSEASVTWANAAADYALPAVTSFTPTTVNQFVAVDVTSLVQDWLQGDAPNYGVMLLATAPGELTRYASREAADPALRPTLDILLVAENVADDFDSNTDYTGNDGSQLWASNWLEIGETDGAAQGLVQSATVHCTDNKCLRIGDNKTATLTGYGARRMVDLSQATSAMLSFTYKRVITNATSTLISLDVSQNGGATWTQLAGYTLDGTNPTPIAQSFDISNYRADDTQIRFIASGTTSGAGYFYVDDVQIVYTVLPPPTAISGRIWDDVDLDGVQDAGEPGILNAQVYLFAGTCGDLSSPPRASQLSNANGDYTFGGLDDGVYCLWVDRGTIRADYAATTDENPMEVALAPGQTYTQANFGYASVYSNDTFVVGLYKPCGNIQWLEQIAASYGAAVVYKNRRVCIFTVEFPPTTDAPALRQAILADGRARYVEYDARTGGAESFVPNDPAYNNSSQVYAPQQINAPEAWSTTRGATNLIVAIADSGASLTHEEFSGRLLPGYDFVNEDADPTDDHGHGTHVTGIALAGINNGLGIAGIAGESKILPVKVLNNNNSGWWSDVSAGVTWAVDQGAKVVNLSLAGTVGSSSLQDALKYAVSHNVLVTAAAGNDNTDAVRYPASYPEVLAVGATTSSKTRWSLSNFGPNVDLMAPGSSVYSSHWKSASGNTYSFLSGTSMAAPHVAGVGALLFSVNPNLSVDEVKQAILNTAIDMGDPGVDALHGYGRVDAAGAAKSVPGGAYQPPQTEMVAELVLDLNGNGVADPGDRLRYVITIANNGGVEMTNVALANAVPANTAYVANSTTIDGIPALDNAAPATAMPLDEGGLDLGPLPPQQVTIVRYELEVLPPPPAFTGVYNEATITVTTATGGEVLTVSTGTPVGGTACTLHFADAAGLELGAYVENDTLVIRLSDADGNTNAATPQTLTAVVQNSSTGDTETVALVETAADSGVFSASLPTSTQNGQASNDGVLRAAAGDAVQVSYTDPEFAGDQCTAIAQMLPSLATKPLYLTDPGQGLDRVDPVATGDNDATTSPTLSAGGAASLVFTQVTALAQDLALPAGRPVRVHLHVNVTVGTPPASPNITATLKSGVTPIVTLTDPTYASGVLTWRGLVGTDVTALAGQKLSLEVRTGEPNLSFQILYDSATYPSRLTVDTTTFIRLDELAVYSAAYPGGAAVASLASGQTGYVRARASDPFGASDITGMDLRIQPPAGCGGALNVNPAVVGSTAAGKTYEYAWTGPACTGEYGITATAHEGSEGVIATRNAGVAVVEAPPPEGRIGNRVWQDVDGDGMYDAAKGDLPLAQATLALSRGGQVVGSASTGTDGAYQFTGLALDTYAVAVSQVSANPDHLFLPAPLGPNPGQDNNNQAQPYQVTLTAQQPQNMTADFAYMLPGDCNADVGVDAGDATALTLEAFDGDGSSAAAAAGGTFRGSATGCDANQDASIDAGDSSCLTLLVFYGPDAACYGGAKAQPQPQPLPKAVAAQQPNAPALTIPLQIPATAGGTVTVPIDFTAGGTNISAFFFSIDYDQTWLTLDPTDADEDGIPDAIVFNVPAAFGIKLATFDPLDTTGEIDFEIRDGSTPLASMPDRTIVTITFQVGTPGAPTEAAVAFSNDPPASFGNTSGQSEPGTATGGSVLISVVVQTPALTLDKSTTTVNYDSVGDVISYSYLVTNSGNVPVTPPYAVSDDKATVSCPQTPDPLNPGASITCTATYVVTQADITVGSVVNIAMASAVYNGNPVNSNQDTVTVPAVQSAAISGRVWEDLDGDGVVDTGEPGLANVQVQLKPFGSGAVLDTQTTDGGGAYQFSGLAGGTYTVDVVDATVPTGFVLTTTSDPLVVTVASGQTATGASFGYAALATVGGLTWVDTNNDGVYDIGVELPVNGVGIEVRDGQGNVVDTLETGIPGGFAPGRYELGGLRPGTYTLVVVQIPTGFNLSSGSTKTVVLQSGEVDLAENFAFASTTGVVVQSFTAQVVSGKMTVRWITLAEGSNEGFHLFRAAQGSGPWQRLTTTPIPSQSIGGSGSVYTWVDRTAAPGVRYWYQLETFPDGQPFGPVQSEAGGKKLFLPLVIR